MFTERMQPGWESMVNVTDPVPIHQGSTLRFRNRNQWYVVKVLVQRLEVRKVKPAVQRRNVRDASQPAERKVPVIRVEVQDVKLGTPRKNLVQKDCMAGKRIRTIGT